MKVFTELTEAQTEPTWADITWAAVEQNVRRLQERIYRATERQEWKKVKHLQKLLVRATSNSSWQSAASHKRTGANAPQALTA
ncbi:MAG: reverse transcriptase N-terminal domain-containing protein [Chloroflexales bacterium]|nr:reverse transcriptase N-terminal domain-containing protein [Chloroflexales bacterium]